MLQYGVRAQWIIDSGRDSDVSQAAWPMLVFESRDLKHRVG